MLIIRRVAFISKFLETFCAFLGPNHFTTVEYPPQINEQTEPFNGTLVYLCAVTNLFIYLPKAWGQECDAFGLVLSLYPIHPYHNWCPYSATDWQACNYIFILVRTKIATPREYNATRRFQAEEQGATLVHKRPWQTNPPYVTAVVRWTVCVHWLSNNDNCRPRAYWDRIVQ